MDAQEFTDVIQVCTDGSSLSEKGVTTAVELAKTLGLPLLGMTVVKGDAPENGLEGEPQEVRDRLQTIAEEAQAAGIPYLILAEHAATPHEGILSVAMRYDARFIVIQPFHVAEVFTGSPGKYVPLKETIRGFKMIVDGECDQLPEQAFYMVGTIDEAFEKAKTIK